MSLRRLYEMHPAAERLTIELEPHSFRALAELARKNAVSPEQMVEEIVNSFIEADTGSAPHL